MSHYFKNIYHPHTIDSTIKSILADAGASNTSIRTDNPFGNENKRGHTIVISSACKTNLPSNTESTLSFTQFPFEGREENLLPGLSQISLISIGKLCDA